MFDSAVVKMLLCFLGWNIAVSLARISSTNQLCRKTTMRWIFNIRPLTLLHISNSRSVGQCLASQKVFQKPCYRNVGFKSIVSVRYVHNIDFEEAVTVKSDSDELLFLRPGRDLLPGSHVDHVRDSLYKVSSDPVVNKLRKCRNYDEVRNFFIWIVF